MPPSIPASEAYFWSAKWQAQEADFEAARVAGKLIKAESMDDVIRDLLRGD